MLGRDKCGSRADTAGDLMCEHCSEDREVHGVGYDTLEKKTVLYNSIAPCFVGDVALRELENLDALFLSFFICSVSVKSRDFHTPR